MISSTLSVYTSVATYQQKWLLGHARNLRPHSDMSYLAKGDTPWRFRQELTATCAIKPTEIHRGDSHRRLKVHTNQGNPMFILA